jgi:hypothetical protein
MTADVQLQTPWHDAAALARGGVFAGAILVAPSAVVRDELAQALAAAPWAVVFPTKFERGVFTIVVKM